MQALLVDSQQAELSALESVLESLGYQLVTVTSGRQAKAAISAAGCETSLLLVDWETPDAPRTDLLEWLQKQDVPPIETILLSQHFIVDDIRIGLEAGAFYFLTKPFDETQLPAVIGAAAATVELRKDLVRKVEESGETLRLLHQGMFRLHRPRQAELLAVQLGSASREPQIGIAILELLLNAIEHGNLGIDYDEKGALLEEDSFREEIQRRLELPEFRNKRVLVEVKQLNNRMEITITDDGPGFRFSQYQKMDKSRIFDSHGRGILMASAAVDVKYYEPGNRVQLTVPWTPSTTT